LFGHVKGAFTSAIASKKGLFEIADRGTLFLDEIGTMSMDTQSKILRVLQDRKFMHLGGVHELQVDVRIIAATNVDLRQQVKEGKFREDLFYRLNVITIDLPPLRQRKEDIPALVNFFLMKYAQDFRRPVPKLSPATQHLFEEYAWPGNIRELEDAAKAIVALGDESVAMGGLRSLLMRSERGGNGERISLKQASRAASREAEKELILKVLQRTRWNRRRAAQELQISYKALLYKLKQIGCEEYGA
jgi:transcriptional regulator with PAS, ATPase and Fis domain